MKIRPMDLFFGILAVVILWMLGAVTFMLTSIVACRVTERLCYGW